MSGESFGSTDSRLFKKPGGKNIRKPQSHKIDANESSNEYHSNQNDYIEQLANTIRFQQYEIEKQKEELISLQNELELAHDQLRQEDKVNTLGIMAACLFHEIGNAATTVGISAPAISDILKELIPFMKVYRDTNGEFMVRGMDCDTFCQEVPKLCSELESGVVRITDIIKSTQDFMRSGVQEFRNDTNLNSCAIKSIKLTENHIHKSTDQLITHLYPDIPNIKGDAKQLEQVVINLIINACQALSDRSNPIVISTEFLTTTNMVELSVVNEGDTAPPEIISRVFEPFFTTKRQSGGTGLGLYISRNIVNEHKGSLHMEALSDKPGTRVVMRLPAIIHS